MAQPQLDGYAIMALKTTSLADGWVLYDYAVYVHNIDRELDAADIDLVISNFGSVGDL